MGNEMNTEVSKVIQGQLDSVAVAVQEVTLLSSKVDDLARELHDHGKLSIDQLEQFKSATGDTQRTLDGLFQNLAKFDEFISAGSTVSEEIREGVIGLKTTLTDTTTLLSALLDRFGKEANAALDNVRQTSSELLSNFAVSVGQLQGAVTDSRRQLVESLESLTTLILETSSRTSSELGTAAQGLLSAAGQVRSQLEEMPNSVEARILERVEPNLARFEISIADGSTAVTNATSSVTAQVAQVAQKSSDEINLLIVRHDGIIKEHDRVATDLQGFLNNAEEFIKMSKALEQNRDLLVEIEKGLSARKSSILDRLDIAVVGMGLGYLVGHFTFGFKNEEVLATLAAPALAVLFSEPLLKAIARQFKGRNNSKWTPPAPPN
jgi:hypothetical protein